MKVSISPHNSNNLLSLALRRPLPPSSSGGFPSSSSSGLLPVVVGGTHGTHVDDRHIYILSIIADCVRKVTFTSWHGMVRGCLVTVMLNTTCTVIFITRPVSICIRPFPVCDIHTTPSAWVRPHELGDAAKAQSLERPNAPRGR